MKKIFLLFIILSSYSFAQNEIIRRVEFEDSLANIRSDFSSGSITGDTVLTGTATINVGADSVIVPHNLGSAPSIENINITPQEDISGFDYWVESITSTTFKIKIGTTGYDALTEPISFSWQIFNADVSNITTGVDSAVVKAVVSDTTTQLKKDYRLSLNNALLYDVTMDSYGDSVKGHWVFDTEFASYYDIDSVGYDLSGNGNNLVSNFSPQYKMIGESPVYAGGKVVLMDGTTNSFYIPAADADDFEVGTSAFSIEAWIKTESNSRQYIVAKHTASDNYYFRVTETNKQLTLKLASTVGGAHSEEIKSDDPVVDGEWHYVACTVDMINNLVEIYVDGIDNNSVAYTIADIGAINVPAADFCVGCIEQNSDPFDGYLAEVRFSKRILTANEIYQQYKKSQHLYQKIYSPLTEAYKLRVLLDGGHITSIHAVEEVYNLGLDLDSLKYWGGVQFGVKYDANNKVVKLYDLSNNQNDLIQTDTSKAFTFSVNGMTGDSSMMQVTFADTIAQPNTTTILADAVNSIGKYFYDGVDVDNRSYMRMVGAAVTQMHAGTSVTTAISCADNKIYTIGWDTTDTLYVNGSYAASGNAGSHGLAGLTLGGDYTGLATFTGTIREIVINNDATKRTIIENSINGRWDVY